MDKRNLLFIIFILLAVLLWREEGRTCTSFQIVHDGQVLVGKSYDFMVEDGLFFVNKRGVSKTAMPSIMGNIGVGQPAKWTSKYGSVTINQFGRELPNGGINEAGLVIETMGLFQNSKYPEPDSRPSIYMLQWLQYQLDNFAAVREVIDSDAQLRIRPKKGVHVHFLASDKDGNCATIEFIDGKMVCHANQDLPYRVLTNNTYEESLLLKKVDRIPVPDNFKSIERFIRAAKMQEEYNIKATKPPLEYSFEILDNVKWSMVRERWTVHTQWSLVYDQSNFRIYFKTRGNRNIREIDGKSFDFSCRTPVMILDINAELSGNVTGRFVEYTRSLNRNLTANSFNKAVYLSKFPEEEFDAIADYPDTTVCGE